jgi:hypothetical protein
VRLRIIFLGFLLLAGFCALARAEDCGVRGNDGTGAIVTLECEEIATSTSPFRVKGSDGKIWALKLVDPELSPGVPNPAASKFRVRYHDAATNTDVTKAIDSSIALSSCEDFQLIGSVGKLPRNGIYYLTDDINCIQTNPNRPEYQGSLWQLGYKAYFTKNGVPVGFDGVPNSGDEEVAGLQPGFGQSGWLPVGAWAGGGGSMEAGVDGRGHTISNLWANQGPGNFGNHGLFGRLINGTIKNLHLRGVHIYGNIRLGGLVGEAVNTKISNCSVEGEVIGDRGSVGGLVGQCGGYWCCGVWDARGNCTIENSYFSGTVTTNSGGESLRDGVGGLLGGGHDFVITNSYFTGSVRAFRMNFGGHSPISEESVVGGLVGYGENTTITNSFSVGTMTRNGLTDNLGGLSGYLVNGTVTNSWWFSASSPPLNNGIGYPADSTAKKAPLASDFFGQGSGTGGSVYNNWDFSDIWEAAPGGLPHLKRQDD